MEFFGKLTTYLTSKKQIEANIVVIGLCRSGKTSIVNLFVPENRRFRVPLATIGVNVECFTNQNVEFKVFDMSGLEKFRDLWEPYYKIADGIIFVIDSSDKLNLVVVKEELDLLLQHPEIASKKIPILFYANKMDLPDSLSSVKIAAGLNLDKIKNKPWYICASNGMTGEGLREGLEWFTQQIRDLMTCTSN